MTDQIGGKKRAKRRSSYKKRVKRRSSSKRGGKRRSSRVKRRSSRVKRRSSSRRRRSSRMKRAAGVGAVGLASLLGALKLRKAIKEGRVRSPSKMYADYKARSAPKPKPWYKFGY